MKSQTELFEENINLRSVLAFLAGYLSSAAENKRPVPAHDAAELAEKIEAVLKKTE